jgi:hypothetical protein
MNQDKQEKNKKDIGEPVELNTEKKDQQNKPGMGQREGQQGGQRPGGGQQPDQHHQGGGTANR